VEREISKLTAKPIAWKKNILAPFRHEFHFEKMMTRALTLRRQSKMVLSNTRANSAPVFSASSLRPATTRELMTPRPMASVVLRPLPRLQKKFLFADDGHNTFT
jgi:hypothetical protein